MVCFWVHWVPQYSWCFKHRTLVSLLAPVLIPYCRSWPWVSFLYSAPVVLHIECCMPWVRSISYISFNYKVEREQEIHQDGLKLKPMTEEKARTAWFRQKEKAKVQTICSLSRGKHLLWFSMFHPYKILESFKPSTFFLQLEHGLFALVHWYFLSPGNSNFLSLWYKNWFDINHSCPKPFQVEKSNIKW